MLVTGSQVRRRSRLQVSDAQQALALRLPDVAAPQVIVRLLDYGFLQFIFELPRKDQ